MNQSGSAVTSQKLIMQSWVGSSMKEILTREPYLIFSVLFLFVRVLVYIIPRVLYHFKVIWASYRPQLNLEIFGETSQILGRILHMIDVKGVWTNLRLCKNRNFRRGARNARVWASSLASVSLGETSTSRLSSWGNVLVSRGKEFLKTGITAQGLENTWISSSYPRLRLRQSGCKRKTYSTVLWWSFM